MCVGGVGGGGGGGGWVVAHSRDLDILNILQLDPVLFW